MGSFGLSSARGEPAMTARTRLVAIAAASIAIVVSVAAGYWWGQSPDDLSATATATASGGATDREVLYWYDPMKPEQRFDKPGKSPYMDMQLLPKYADDASESGISIAPGVRQNLGMRTIVVKRGRLGATVRVTG